MTLISYSQNLEDIVLFRALNDVKDGFYIDIGAYDPVEHSVTKLFYDQGWRGINVEPVRSQFDQLCNSRPRDINLNVAVAPKPGEITLYEIGGLSTMVEDIAARHNEAGLQSHPVNVPALTLENVLSIADNSTIHFLKIDIEGAEEAVVTSTQFDRIRPWIIVIEATRPLTQIKTHEVWHNHVEGQDYKFVYFDGLNRYYLANEQASRRTHFEAPPNVFDDYKTSHVAKMEIRIQEGEQWRQQLIASISSYEDLNQRFNSLKEEAEGWRQDLILRDSAICDLQQRFNSLKEEADGWRHGLVQRDSIVTDLQQRFNSLKEEAEGWRQGLIHRDSVVADLQQRFNGLKEEADGWRQALIQRDSIVADLEQHLANVYRSKSWRLTGPLRGLATRHPALSGRLRRAAATNPRLVRGVLRTARVMWRLSTLRSPLPEPPSEPIIVSAQAPQERAAPPPSAPHPASTGFVASVPRDPSERVWFFLGDTIEWLTAHEQLTGIGRVTAELFLASIQGDDAAAIPCALAYDGRTLASLSVHDSVSYLAARTGSYEVASLCERGSAAARAPATAFIPAPGDHVVFTGVVWSPTYTALFDRLSAAGTRFSVLVYDIIPLEHPEYVDDAHYAAFVVWLDSVLARATIVFVSSAEIRDRILRWATLSERMPAAQIVPITFGTSRLRLPSAPDRAAPESLRVTSVRWKNFVLSVGTIDRRKNQAALCSTWARLRMLLSQDQLPQLVLVGRDDNGLAELSDDVVELIRAGDILVLEGIADDELVELYVRCLFTVFPSLSEGYGLPVAESLMHGKLCVASDLAVIRDHAGELPWYIPPGDEVALLNALHRAIVDAPARAEAEQHIVENYRARDWIVTWRSMYEAIRSARNAVPAVAAPRPEIPGVPRVAIREALRRAQLWCTEALPEVSILIVNWHAVPLTLECIRQIWANTEDIHYEILIADNGSDPASLHQLRQLGRGVRLLELGVNRFFGEANNIAAEHAKGRFLCFLNNDAFGQPGWLGALRDALEVNREAGAAGPLFLFPNGTIQEAGGNIDARGYPIRAARGEALEAQTLLPGAVDYISAAALLVRTECFMQAQGFDLAYEPAYYEDVDLCFKLRALGRPVLFCPKARVIHIEGAAANGDPGAEAHRAALGDLNRGKFTARWSQFLETRSEDILRQIATNLLPNPHLTPTALPRARRAAVFTPYPLTPGGGERFLLTIASILAEDHETTIVTGHPYSRTRLQGLGRELGIDLRQCRLATEAEFRSGPLPDTQVVMGNHIFPPIPATGERNFFVCQFPFPMEAEVIRRGRDTAGPYHTVITYSDYARAHVLAALSAHQMPHWPVEVVFPPVPQYEGNAGCKRRMVLTIGRFFSGGHSKRHDLLIAAFRRLLELVGPDVEMHICGSSTPDDMGYLADLQKQAADLPVTFHVNASIDRLAGLYRDAALYWHATGLGAVLSDQPWAAEHFGITVVEAMSAACVPMAFNAGGPREIVTSGINGILYDSLNELVDGAARLLMPGQERRREAMGRAAACRAALFSPAVFRDRVRPLLLHQGSQISNGS